MKIINDSAKISNNEVGAAHMVSQFTTSNFHEIVNQLHCFDEKTDKR